MSKNPIQLISDSAIAESENSRSDALEFSTYAEVIARVVRGTRGPFTIGVFGEWGMGKTSLMRLVEREIKEGNTEDSTIIPVWFNAWMFEKVEYPVIPLIKSITEALREAQKLRSPRDDSITKLIDGLEALAVAFKLKGKLGLPGGDIEASFDSSNLRETYSNLRNRRNQTPENHDSYEQIFDSLHRISNNLVPQEITVMVLVDDLDRCFPENAVKLLESIKLILSQPGFTFVLGASRIVIEEYLQSKYEKQYGIQHFNGTAYLDKMIQLTFDIPPHSSRIDLFTQDVINGLNDQNTRNELKPISATIGEVCQYNPRTIIRFINRLITDSAIYKQKDHETTGATLPLGIFAVTRSLQQMWKDIYGLLISGDPQEDQEYCQIVGAWNEKDIDGWSKYDDSDRISSSLRLDIARSTLVDPEVLKQIASYISRDRGLRSLLRQKIGHDWLTQHDLREASISFLMTQPSNEVTKIDSETRPDLKNIYKHSAESPTHDRMYSDAVMTVISLNKASTSLLQRKMRIGYARAARMIEQMEKEGIIAPADGIRPRDILVKDFDEARLLWTSDA